MKLKSSDIHQEQADVLAGLEHYESVMEKISNLKLEAG